jgi:hypothetical protein
MSDAEEFVARAVECETQAKGSSNPEIKRLLCETAANWRKLAEYAQLRDERMQRDGPN